MAGAIRKMAVYLGLVEDDRYNDEYEEYDDDYLEESVRGRGAYDGALDRGERRHGTDRGQVSALSGKSGVATAERVTADLNRITTLCPRTYNEARTIGEQFREGVPVIMNLTEMLDSDAKRLVDFSAGLIFGLHGSIDRITNKVFLLCPANVEVTAEDKARIAEGGFFNQS
jgi:cell division inhibitor SepF